ncbi:MAG: hypothetical protein LBE80_03375, partial [Deltaproteobacteria bacterium]|nr:hypothetical protein [Deltaproteobacteria bacterium]
LYRDELLETKVTLPCLITVLGEKFTLRLPSLKAKLQARLVNKLSLEDLIRPLKGSGAGPLFGEKGSPTKILKCYKAKGPERVLARPSPAEAAAVIIEAAQKAKS